MKLEGSEQRAHQVRTRRQAARMHNDLDYELAYGAHPEDHYLEGERARRVLQDRYPGVENDAQDVTDPPRLSHTAQRGIRESGNGNDRRRPSSGNGRRQAARSRPGHKHPTARRSSPSRRAGRVLPTASDIRQGAAAVAPEPVADVASLAWTLMTAGIGMSIAYLLLTRPKLITDVTGLLLDGFVRLASPHYDLFTDGSQLPGVSAPTPLAAIAVDPVTYRHNVPANPPGRPEHGGHF